MVMWRVFTIDCKMNTRTKKIFLSVLEAQIVIEDWRLLYNRVHPHSQLGFQSPDQFAINHPRPETNILSGPEIVI